MSTIRSNFNYTLKPKAPCPKYDIKEKVNEIKYDKKEAGDEIKDDKGHYDKDNGEVVIGSPKYSEGGLVRGYLDQNGNLVKAEGGSIINPLYETLANKQWNV